MTAIFLTAEVTIGAVTGVLTIAEKASGNAIGDTIGAAIGVLTNALKASGNWKRSLKKLDRKWVFLCLG